MRVTQRHGPEDPKCDSNVGHISDSRNGLDGLQVGMFSRVV